MKHDKMYGRTGFETSEPDVPLKPFLRGWVAQGVQGLGGIFFLSKD